MEADSSRAEHEAWFRDLRGRFLDVARRRVGEEDAEDVVQDALRVVHEKGPGLASEARIEGQPPVAWCFQVLRHTIGNYYRRRDFRRERLEPAADPADQPDGRARATPVEACESDEALRLIERALTGLRESDPGCASYLDRILDGHSARDLAAEEGVGVPVLSRRLYRCREKLKRLLRGMGVLR